MKYETYVEYRDRKGMVDHKIAKECGIPKSTFSAWKRGLYTPKLDKQVRIAELLGIPTSEVLVIDDKEMRRKG